LHTMKITSIHYMVILLSGICMLSCSSPGGRHSGIDQRVDSLLALMTLGEKIGQLCQVSGTSTQVEEMILQGKIGSVLNEVDPATVNRLQKIAREKSRLGIPLIIGRDVIHGFKTIFPIPLGMAATWNPELIEKGAAVAASEAASVGIRWTFAPMLDVSRDARWGRVAESFGEDTYLCTRMGSAMIKGFQGENLADRNSIAACAKHFAAYGAAEGGRDYNSVDMSMQTLFNVYLPPFNKAVDEGVATFMVSFNEINGIPSTGNIWLVRDMLKDKWHFNGFVVSDWASVDEMINHGFAADRKDAAMLAFNAGVDMEMVTTSYNDYLKELIDQEKINGRFLDDAVRRILTVKYQLGLFKNSYVDENVNFDRLDTSHLSTAKETAVQSLVLLKNENSVLPLSKSVRSIAVIGPMADDGYEQLGTWIFDGEERHSITPLESIRELLQGKRVIYEKALDYTRDLSESKFSIAVSAANRADAVIVFVGEESILSGEAHCRADITLPGKQAELVRILKQTGKPLIMVVLAGRPLALRNVEPFCDAILYAWHPGTMGGPAITEVLFGDRNPTGKLPVSLPVMSGQEPCYYSHKATGRPASAEQFTAIDKIPRRAFQTSLGNTSHYIDAGYQPEYCFGYGLSYTHFKYCNLRISKPVISIADTLRISIEIENTGSRDGRETVQLYLGDVVGSITRPVKELKDFKLVFLRKGERQLIEFTLTANDLAFFGRDMVKRAEPGEFKVFVGGNSIDCLEDGFKLEE
jgi:beta-glucosidase